MKDLKTLAQQAKDRLRGNGYTDVKTLRLIKGENVEFRRVLQVEEENEKLYVKVKDILSREEEFCNPISYLMDMNYYNSLCNCGKERYFFEIVDKFQNLKERYFREQSFKTNTYVS